MDQREREQKEQCQQQRLHRHQYRYQQEEHQQEEDQQQQLQYHHQLQYPQKQQQQQQEKHREESMDLEEGERSTGEASEDSISETTLYKRVQEWEETIMGYLRGIEALNRSRDYLLYLQLVDTTLPNPVTAQGITTQQEENSLRGTRTKGGIPGFCRCEARPDIYQTLMERSSQKVVQLLQCVRRARGVSGRMEIIERACCMGPQLLICEDEGLAALIANPPRGFWTLVLLHRSLELVQRAYFTGTLALRIVVSPVNSL